MELVDSIEDKFLIEKVGSVDATPETQVALMRIFRAILEWGLKCYQKKSEQKDGFFH
jgi:hypothetical protein